MEKIKQLLKTSEPIKESEILSNLSPDMINVWDDFMRGKTCPILDNGEHGVYSWDLVQFLNTLNKLEV